MRNIIKNLLFAVSVLFLIGIITAMSVEDIYAKDAEGNYVIILDPGHGGDDVGATSLNGDYERDLNWNIAQALKAELESYSGVKVYLTKGSSEPFSNTGRGRMGIFLNADYVVSVHNNSGAESATGAVCFGTVNPQVQTLSQQMCMSIADQLAPYVGYSVSGGYSARPDSTMTAADGSMVDYYTLIDEAAKCGIPALIIEHCYLSNPKDSAFIHDINNQRLLGEADAKGIAACLGLQKRIVVNGDKITLERSYSAIMASQFSGTFTTDNPSVVNVLPDGTITALHTGNANVKLTTTTGTVETVNVTVPQVKLVGINAGSMNTRYRTQAEALAFKNNPVMVKAIYSDGTATQIDGATIGDATEVETVEYILTNGAGTTTATAVDVPISYMNASNKMRLYYGPDLDLGTYNANNSYPVGTNTSEIMVPGSFDIIKVMTASENAAEVIATKADATVKDGNASGEGEASNQSEKDNGGQINIFNILKFIIIAAVALVVIIIIITVIMHFATGNSQRRAYNKRRRKRNKRKKKNIRR